MAEEKDAATNSFHIIPSSEYRPVDNTVEFQEYLAPDESVPSPLSGQTMYRTPLSMPSAPPPYSPPISTSESVPGTPKKHISGIYVVIAALALLLIGGTGGGLLLFASHFRTPAPQTSGLHLGQHGLTSSGAQTPTTPLALYLQATSDTPIIVDPLTSASTSSWQNSTNSDSTGYCTFSSDGYHVVETKSQTLYFCTSSGSYFVNFAFQVQMTILRGDAGGVVFRAIDQLDEFSMYRFRIDQDGSYSLFLHTSRSTQDIKTLIAGSSNAINTGLGQSNLITVIASGGTIYMYVNGLFVAHVNDSSLGGGRIGLTASDLGNPAEVVFQNVKVWII